MIPKDWEGGSEQEDQRPADVANICGQWLTYGRL
jgi:hypothetical protein